VIHKLFVCQFKGALNLGSVLGALNMDNSPHTSKPRFDMHLEVVKLVLVHTNGRHITDGNLRYATSRYFSEPGLDGSELVFSVYYSAT
jgi:hypothetical protein